MTEQSHAMATEVLLKRRRIRAQLCQSAANWDPSYCLRTECYPGKAVWM